MNNVIKYEHYGAIVSVREELKGRHRDHCLCHICRHLNIDDREKNCPIANKLYAICCECNVVTPVWECPRFEVK